MKPVSLRNSVKRISLILVLLTVISTNSCKKDAHFNEKPSTNSLSQIDKNNKITDAEVNTWLKNFPADLLPDIQLKKAEQKIVNGHLVIRLPIADDAAIFITKEDGIIRAYAYKWQDKAPGKKEYTGNLITYSFQDNNIRALVYKSGKVTRWVGGNIYNQVKTVSSGLKTMGGEPNNIFSMFWCILRGGRWVGFATGCSLGSEGWLGKLVEAVSSLFNGDEYDDDATGGTEGNTSFPAGIWYGQGPYVEPPTGAANGTYSPTGGGYNGTVNPDAPYGGGNLWVSRWVEDGCPTGPGGDGSYTGINDDPSGPGGCSVSTGHWETHVLPYSNLLVVNNVINLLNLTDYNAQIFLHNNFIIANELNNYLLSNSTTLNISIAKQHIDRLMNDAYYLAFTENHSLTGNADIVWWNDELWLDAPGNLNLSFGPEYESFKKLTKAEKDLVSVYPIAGYLISKNRPIAESTTVSVMGINGLNDKSDAFRHTFFNAINERDCGANTLGLGISIAKLFSDAHESETPASLLLEKQMDIYNNTKGQTIPHIPNISNDNNSYVIKIIDMLARGELRYLNPLDFSVNNRGIIPSTILTPTNQ